MPANAPVFSLLDPNWANAIGAGASAVIALVALLVAIVSAFISVRALRIQREHNMLSLTPLLRVSPVDLEERLAVVLKNNGPGPVLIQKISATLGSDVHDSIRRCLDNPPASVTWESYVGPVDDESMAPGEEICLLALRGDVANPEYVSFRDLCRARLADITLTVAYTDVYKQQLKLVKPLRWYGRPHS
jgi:hypothetical protein